MRKLATLAATFVLTAGLVGCQNTDALTQPGSEARASQAAEQGEEAACRSGSSIVDIASNSGFDALVTAVTEAGLADALDGPEHVTVFAPTDEAFADAAEALGYSNAGALVADLKSKGLLTEVLLYHVTAGDRPSESVVNTRQLRMENGGTVSVDGTELTDAAGRTSTITTPDIEACNGYVHVIDTVLLPVSPSAL